MSTTGLGLVKTSFHPFGYG